MANEHDWQSQIRGKDYSFTYRHHRGKHQLTANGEPIEVKKSFIRSFLSVVDEEIMLDGMEARFVIEDGTPDIVVDGFHVESGKEYISLPKWVWVFCAACVIMFVGGGLLPALLGIGGASLCLKVSKMRMPVITRVMLCLGITVGAWAIMLMVVWVLM